MQGPIEKLKSHHGLNKKKMKEALDQKGKKKVEKKKNPYPKGSYRAKLWDRRERERKEK